MTPRMAAAICEIIDRLQAGHATRVDAELLETLADDEEVNHDGQATEASVSLDAAANALRVGDTLEALAQLNSLKLAP
jgi:hypothetical protein